MVEVEVSVTEESHGWKKVRETFNNSRKKKKTRHNAASEGLAIRNPKPKRGMIVE